MKPKHKEIYSTIEHATSFALIGAIVVVLTMQVFFRYVVLSPLYWSEELARFVQIWAVFAGATFAFRRGTHMNIDLISFYLPKNAVAVVDIIARIIMTVFFGLVAYIGWKFASRFWDIKSAAIGLPLGIVYLILPITSIANAFCVWFPTTEE